jgi:hypothetical protein
MSAEQSIGRMPYSTTGIPVDTDWHRFETDNDGTTTRFSIDGVEVATSITNRYTGAVSPYFAIATSSATENDLLIDFFLRTMVVDR